MIWGMADHRKLEQVLVGLYNQISFYLAVNTRLHKDLAVGVADHQAILDAIIVGDEDGIARTIDDHLEEAVHIIIDAL